MKRHGWSGRWPTDEYPPDGTRIRFRTSQGRKGEGVVVRVWCGVEPVIDLDTPMHIFPSFDEYEVAEKADGVQ